MLNSNKYFLVNNSEKTKGGPFTRYDPSDPLLDEKKSVLELVIISSDLEKHIEEMTIDKNLEWTPKRVVKGNQIKHPDHYAIVVLFKDIPLKENSHTIRKTVRWNTNRPDGWMRYKNLTTNHPKLEKIANDDIENVAESIKMINDEINKVKFAAFGKVKERSKPTTASKAAMLEEEKAKIITAIKETKEMKGKAAAIFKLKDDLLGNKKAAQEPTVLINPDTMKEENTVEGIKKISLNYCQNLLTNRPPKPDYNMDINLKNILHDIRMKIDDDDRNETLTIEMFQKSYEALLKNLGKKYPFITGSGSSLKNALFNVFQFIWKSENYPEEWQKSTLIQLFKGKGRRDDLNSQRYIHTKEEIPKFFGPIVISAAKEDIIKNMTKFQIATKPGHRSSEHLFVVKSLMVLNEHLKKAMIISLWDLKKYFDSENLRDCMSELYKNNIRGKLYRLLFKMNKNVKIRVKTAVGATDEVDTGETVAQGSLEAALVSTVNLDNGVNDYFGENEEEENEEVCYGDMNLRPLLYQDDVLKMSETRLSSQVANNKMETMAETKLLDFNLDKSAYLITGNRKARKDIMGEIVGNPLIFCGEKMKKVKDDKYLGDWISCTVADSVCKTGNKRIGLATRAIYDIKTIIQDCRAQVVGGITVALNLWEMGNGHSAHDTPQQ